MPKYALFTEAAGNPKIAKGLNHGWYTLVLHLAPHTLAGRGNVCSSSTEGCRAGCLSTAGRGGIGAGSDEDIRAGRTNAIQAARVRRTRLFFDEGAAMFASILRADIFKAERYCAKHGFKLAVRFNGTSDLPWERIAPEIFAMFPDVRFYDYTKHDIVKRPRATLPANYTLTLSFSGSNHDACADAMNAGYNTAVVFSTPKGKPLPATFGPYRVVDGDETDLRFLDPCGVVVGLRAKGRAKKDTSGFVVRV
jgi:hypothetical protein